MPRKASELNALAVSRLTTPGLHFVGGVPGLALQVMETGARTWVLRVSIGHAAFIETAPMDVVAEVLARVATLIE